MKRGISFLYSPRAFPFTVMLLTGIAITIRVYGAWVSRVITHPDCSVVALMATHIADGHPWPTFFYGQHYMGSLEPLVSAGWVLLLGPTGFAVNLGPVTVAILAWGVFLGWVGDSCGRRGLLWAALLALWGPMEYFYFQFSPRGGYMVALLTSTLLVWMSGRISVRLFQQASTSFFSLFILGLIAGVGLWSHLIIISAVLTALLLLLIGIRFRVTRYLDLALPGGIGFLVGFFPWILYNLRTSGASLGMLRQAGGIRMQDGLDWLPTRWEQLWRVYGVESDLVTGIAWMIPVMAGVGFLWGGAQCVRERRWDREAAGLTGSAVLTLFSILFFIRSEFAAIHAPRYVIPLYLPLLLPTAWVLAKARKGWVVLPITVVVAVLSLQAPILTELQYMNSRVAGHRASQQGLRDILMEIDQKHIYAALQQYPLNFRLKEDLVFQDARKTFYPPFAEALERAESPAFLQNYQGIEAFVDVSHSTATSRATPLGTVLYDLSPPSSSLPELLSPRSYEVTVNDEQTDVLSDRRLDTGVVSGEIPGEVQIVVRLEPVRILRKMVLTFAPPSPREGRPYPHRYRVETRESLSSPWKEVVAEQGMTRFYWSGPRVYLEGRRERVELGLPEVPLYDVRLTLIPHPAHGHPDWRLLDLRCYSPSGSEPPHYATSVAGLVEVLNQKQLTRIYGDRWLSLQLAEQGEGDLNVELNEEVGREGGLESTYDVEINAHTALILNPGEEQSTLDELTSLEVEWTSERVGPWTLISFPSSGDSLFSIGKSWTGLSLYRGDPLR